MQTLLQVIQKTTAFFEKKGIENARLNAELIFAHVLDCKRLDLYLQFERPLLDSELDTLRPLVKRRSAREPLQYIVGDVEFCGLKLKVDARALIPRSETEELIECVQKQLKDGPERIVDLGTGTGAIALALAQHYTTAAVWAIDKSEDALALAQENAVLNGLEGRVQWVCSDWWADFEETGFDCIVSNPPYLTQQEWESAEPEVKDFEPFTALVAEDAGMCDLKQIMEGAYQRLNTGGLLAMETGIEQHAALIKVARAIGFEAIESHQDLSGRERFLAMQK